MIVNILGREFDEEKVTPKNKAFDAQEFKDYREFLLSVPETEVVKMPIKHAYERMRFIGQEEQPRLLKEAGYIQPNQRHEQETQRSGTGKPKKVYKMWNQD